jgi:plasmid stability protein
MRGRSCMPNLSIKNVPDELVGKLRERARANHRSLQGELLALVSQAISEPLAAVDAGRARHVRQGHKSIEQIAAEHRTRVEQPIRKGGRSVELIRKERDAR